MIVVWILWRINKMKLKDLLFERYINIYDKNEMKKYIDVVWDMMQKSYEYAGGFHSADDKEDLIKKSDMWKLVKKDDKIVAGKLYKFQNGRKVFASGSDGSVVGKQFIKKIYQDDAKTKRCWGEFSGKTELMMIKYGAEKIPNKYAQGLLGDNKIINSYDSDGYHYTRTFSGNNYKKIMLGNFEVDDELKRKLIKMDKEDYFIPNEFIK